MIVQTPRSPPAQMLERRYRPRVMAIACLYDDAAAVPDLQLTDQPMPRSRLHEMKPWPRDATRTTVGGSAHGASLPRRP